MMAAFLVSAGIYGFAILAMLVPAVGDFDIAPGPHQRHPGVTRAGLPAVEVAGLLARSA